MNAQPSSIIEEELLIQLSSDINADLWISKFEENNVDISITSHSCLSERLNIFQLNFNKETWENGVILEKVKYMEGVENVQFNHRISARVSTQSEPSDPLFVNQWNLHNTGQTGGKQDADIDALEAWEITTGGMTSLNDEIVVAVLDEGFDINHPDIIWWKNQAEIPFNGIDDDQNGFIDDYDGWDALRRQGEIPLRDHGTHVAGIVGAKTNNEEGISGVNWGINIMPVVALGSEATVVEAYSYVLEMRMRYNETQGKEGAFIVASNASFGLQGGQSEEFPLWCAIFDALGQAGVLSVAATSNDGRNVDIRGDMPSSCSSDFLITTTLTDDEDQKPFIGAFGANTIDLAAPGTNILSTFPNNSYAELTGTSEAAPHVTGVIGLLYAAACPSLMASIKNNPASNALLMKELLLKGTDKLSQLAEITRSGGRLNANNSLLELLSICDSLGTCVPPYHTRLEKTGDTIKITWEAEEYQSFLFSYRLSADSSWQIVSTDTQQVALSSLPSCMTYEFRIATVCQGDTSAYTDTETFVSSGCCEAPATLTINHEGGSNYTAMWENAEDSQGYIFEIHQLNDSIITAFTVGDTSLRLNSLEACTPYEFFVSSICEDTVSKPISIIFTTQDCPECVTRNYCTSKGLQQSIETEWIAGITIGEQTYTSGDDQGYRDYTHRAFNLTAGQDLPLVLTPGFSDDAFTEYWRIWMDLDQDGAFDPEYELIYDSGRASREAIMDSIHIPWNSLPGNTRMRVSMSFINGVDPCGFFDNAEVEDYCVFIQSDTFRCASQAVCLPEVSSSPDFWIEELNIQGFKLKKGSNPGYQQYQASTLSLVNSSELNLKLNPGFIDQSLLLFWQIWLDKNNNGVFEEGELLFRNEEASSRNIETIVFLDSIKQIGPARLRIIASPALSSACDSFINGELMDICLNLDDALSYTDNILDDIKLFPNPSSKNIQILSKERIEKLMIFDQMGTLILKKEHIASKDISVDIGALSAGFYFLQIWANGKQGIRKIIKQ